MEKKLFINAFAKAEKNSASKSKTRTSEYLAEELRQYKSPGAGDKNLRRYYNKYELNNGDTIEPTKMLLDALSMYLGCNNYEHFITENQNEKTVDLEKEKINIEEISPEIENIDAADSDVRQRNLFSFFNRSRVKKPKGKTNQFNLFGFGNKQEVDNE